MTRPRLGVCYYPEHWPEADWAAHASAIRALGIEYVRIGEFCWSRIEPRHERFDWRWLDSALESLSAAGLEIILCTPTACPPQWLVARHPDILPRDVAGNVRGFGSRRHYAFSSEVYGQHCDRIVTAMLERYADCAQVVGWQIDNEFGCHDTTVGFGSETEQRFQTWLQNRYRSIEALNDAWGTEFWSQAYSAFDTVELPGAAVTESNPAHTLALRRFASEEVRRFGERQASLIRQKTPTGVWLTHNFMGNFTDFDHYDAARDLDLASWDSYPLGFLDQGWFDEETKSRYRRTGHPDWAAFHHDLYRGVCRGRFAVMEQQPGPVNWADNNAAPLPGMVRLWSWEAIAHGAEFVSFFRWQQYPKAQEQMHSALNLPTGEAADVQTEIRQLAGELATIAPGEPATAEVALAFDYPSCWMAEIQPHAAEYSAFRQAFDYYSAARRLGLDMDIVSPDSDFSKYRLILVPAVLSVDRKLVSALEASGAQVLIGPRCGSKTAEFSIPPELPPGALQSLIPLRVVAVDSIRADNRVPIAYGNNEYYARCWLEHIDTDLEAKAATADGTGVYFAAGACHYVGAVTSPDFLRQIILELCRRAGIDMSPVAGGLRLRRRGNLVFAFNYGPDSAALPAGAGKLLLGSAPLARGEIAVWRDPRAH